MQDIISSVLEISPNYGHPNGLLFDLCWETLWYIYIFYPSRRGIVACEMEIRIVFSMKFRLQFEKLTLDLKLLDSKRWKSRQYILDQLLNDWTIFFFI